MKFNFKIFIALLTLKAFPYGILITHNDKAQLALKAKEFVTKDQGIPASLIKLMNIKRPCSPYGNSILQICINENGETKKAFLNQRIFKKAYKVFSNEK